MLYNGGLVRDEGGEILSQQTSRHRTVIVLKAPPQPAHRVEAPAAALPHQSLSAGE